MSAARTIPDAVRGVQIEAASPDHSAFVSANAGSGKTHVLAQRVINLLLRGCDPAKILCITFTKAAAANMANRVFGTLAEWATLDDDALDERIRLSSKEKPDAKLRARARRLFASALETPGGLKVQTIHAFCTRLLHQFPFEANVAARFSVLDEASTVQLLDRLTLDVLLQASAAPDSALGRALATAIVVAADQTFKDVVGDAIRERDAIAAWIERAGGIEQAIAGLSQGFGLSPDDSAEKIERDYFAASLIPEAEWPALIEFLATSDRPTDTNLIGVIESLRSLSGRERIGAYLQIFCKTTLEPRANVLTKNFGKANPEWNSRLITEQTRVCALLEKERALAARDRTAALIAIAKEVIDRYAREKEKRALLDYDDLIDKTLALFENVAAAWVLYKLDLGIDHILIDEAQDTSPKQWRIVGAIADEFMPGGSRPNVRRTLFAVGDEKQSIFSFQGAAPRAFDEMRRAFERQFTKAELGWKHLRFHHSFRSGVNVLGSVDRVFKERDIYVSVTADEIGIPEHLALPEAAPGLVELWPLVEPAERKEIEGWDAPFDTESERSPRVRLAQRIARHVKLWTGKGLKPGDVLVLVRQRGPLFEAIIRALKYEGVPVAGADRLVLTEHIAVMDLMALADCLLLAADDLALAGVLKSPLFGLTEEQLFELAWNRGKKSLRQSLRDKSGDTFFAAVDAELDTLRGEALRLSPFAFFAEVLGPRRGRKQIPRPARAGSQRRARRIPQSRARLRGARNAVAARLSRLAQGGESGSQARHGNGARRGARDDGARRQGAGGKYRDPRRHHHAADGTARSAPVAARKRRARLGDRARRRRAGGCHGAPPSARGRARRIPAAALRRDDARRRAADRVRQQGHEQNPGRLLVPAGERRARRRMRERGGRRRRRRGAALSQAGSARTGARRHQARAGSKD